MASFASSRFVVPSGSLGKCTNQEGASLYKTNLHSKVGLLKFSVDENSLSLGLATHPVLGVRNSRSSLQKVVTVCNAVESDVKPEVATNKASKSKR